MTTILVTGPIGGGKSTVCKYLERKGFPVYDCDSRCKRLYDTVPGLRGRIESCLGIPFGELGAIFHDEDLRSRLESIVYPLLADDIRQWKTEVRGRVSFIESANAMDKPVFDSLYDKVLMVTAWRSLRFRRSTNAAERDGLQSFDASRADFIIKNNASRKALYDNVDIFLKTII